MKPPTHLAQSAPALTFRYISTWASNAAALHAELEGEYDQESAHAAFLRDQIIECCAHIFAAVAIGHPESRHQLGKGLDVAQRAIGPVPPLARCP